MRRSFALITLIVSVAVVAVACGDDADPARDVADTTTTSSTTTTEPAGPPATFCEGVEQLNLLLDDIARTMLATMAGEPPAEFIVVLGSAVDLLDQTAALAPDEASDAIGLVADAYAGFEALLFVTFDVVHFDAAVTLLQPASRVAGRSPSLSLILTTVH